MSKNVAVFVDVANIFYAAKAAGADIDYVTLLKAAVGSRDFVRAYAYTGLDPENENQRNFHSFLARHGYKVVSKDIRKYGDGKVKANLDIELVVDMMKTARNLDVAVVISGDGDFAPAIRAVQEMGVRVEVISFRGNTSSDLMDVADAFYDITALARVDRDSTRSGRRVAGDEEDLSMTEVPNKQTEGRGGRRRRGGGRGEGRVEGRVDGRGEAVAAQPEAGRGAGSSRRGGGRLVALPGEKLSHAQAGDAEAPLVEPDVQEPEELEEGQEAVGGEAAGEGRRRRRRGGRGRGRGGHASDGALEPAAPSSVDGEEITEGDGIAAAPRPNQFGSVWDSQIGMVGRPERMAPLTPDEDDFAEPEIPEYLLAERRRSSSGGGRGRGQGGRGGVRSAYASAVERERYGRSAAPYSQPVRQPQQPQQPRRRDERQRQAPPQQRGSAPRGGGRSSDEPWSEVPPEVEELLRASLAARMTASPTASGSAEGAAETGAQAQSGGEATPKKTVRKTTTRRKAAASDEATAAAAAGETGETAAAAPKKRAPARRKTTKSAEGEATAEPAAE